MSKLLPTIGGGLIAGGLATLGGLGGGPAGFWVGWSIGTTVGGILEGIMNKPRIPNSPMGDLRFSGSSYGTPLAMLWGDNKVPGIVSWVANYKNNKTLVPSELSKTESGITHLKYKTKKSGGGKGQAETSTKEFYASYQITFGLSSLLYDNNTIVGRNPVITKIWADDLLIYDASNPAANKLTIRFHYGGETDEPDSLIVAAENPGHPEKVNADRSKITCVIENHKLTPHGGRIPTILRAEIKTDAVSLGDILNDICGPVGLYGGYIDTSLCTQPVRGYMLADQVTAQSALDGLISYFYTDCIEVDGKLKFIPRGASVVATIDPSEIGASLSGTEGGGLSRSKGKRSELPGKMEVLYYDVDKDYQQMPQYDIKQTANFRNDSSVTLPMSMTASQAKKIAAFLLDTSYLETDSFQFTLSWKWSWLSPTDCVNVIDNGLQYRLRIVTIDREEGGVLTITAVIDDPSSTIQVTAGTNGNAGSPVVDGTIYPITFAVRSGFALTENERGLVGFYTWANWDTKGSGGTIYYSTDSGVTWIEGSTISGRSAFGVVSSNGGIPLGHDVWETSPTTFANINIAPLPENVVLETVSDDAVLNGSNTFLFGEEIVSFTNVNDLGSGNYKVSRIRRARGLTPNPSVGYSSGDSIYELGDDTVFTSVPDIFVGTNVQVKVLAPGQTLSDVSAQNVVIAGTSPTDTQIILNNGVFPYMITPVTLASYAGGSRTSVAWTTIDVSSYVLPNTKFVNIFFIAKDKGDPAYSPTVKVRKQTGQSEYTIVDSSILFADDDINFSFPFMVELSDALTFDYFIDEGFVDGWSIGLYSAFAPIGNGSGGTIGGGTIGTGSSTPIQVYDQTSIISTNALIFKFQGAGVTATNPADDGTIIVTIPGSTGGGTGTVTSFAFTNANGISGSVSNAATTPTLSLSLGAITPTSIVASGTIKASNFVSSDGSAGGTATTAGLVFKNGLYISGTFSGGSGTVTNIALSVANGLIGNVTGPTGSATIFLSINTIQPSIGYKSIDGSTGASSTQAGLVFKNGLYVSGTFAGGSTAFPGSRTIVNNTNYTLDIPDRLIVFTNLTSAKTVTLPENGYYPVNQLFFIKDQSGKAGTYNITVASEIQGLDPGTGAVISGGIDGGASKSITTNYGVLRMYHDGTNWFTL